MKETDRLAALANELKKLGADVESKDDDARPSTRPKTSLHARRRSTPTTTTAWR